MPKFRLPKLTMTTDIAIFTIREDRLEILLIQRGNPPFQGDWALPGGLVEEDEDLDVCARRELEEETGVADVSLEQLHTFGAPNRDPRGRYVTAAYYTMVRPDRLKPKAASDAANVRWFAVEGLPTLAFDHAEIIAMARRRLRARLYESADAFGYLPATFTLEEFRKVVAIVSGDSIDSRNFRYRVQVLGLVEETGGTQTGTRRVARLYRARRLDPS
ncbi:MAG: NUDIX domain-containing protein [Isosphaeraceae bacterium]